MKDWSARYADTMRATVRIRRRKSLGVVRPSAEQLEGRTFCFRFGWVMNNGDTYPGEVAWIPDDEGYPKDAPAWIASGDLHPETGRELP